MKQYFCISDVHSYYDAMMEALNSKGFDINNDEHILVVCGDLLDRGPDGISCVNFVSNLIWQKKKGGSQNAHHFAKEHEYILCYAK